jgi:hypothetical protein
MEPSRVQLRAGGRLYASGVPALHRVDFRVGARFARGSRLGDGVLVEQGDWNGGWALLVHAGTIRWVLNHFGAAVYEVRSELPDTVQEVELLFRSLPPGGVATLTADGQSVGDAHIPVDFPRIWTPSGGFLCVGHGTGFPVIDAYRNPAEYTGDLIDLVIEVPSAAPELPGFERAVTLSVD